MEVVLPSTIQRQLDQEVEIERQLGIAPAPVQGNTESAEPLAVETREQPAVEEATNTPVATPAPADDTWEQKFHVLRGKYEAEVPRLHAQVRELTEQLTRLLQQREEKPTPPEAPAEQKLVTSADEETFGADLVDLARRAAREEVARMTQTIDQRVDQKVKPVEERLTQSATQVFWQKVDEAVPDFETVNKDSRWFQFLDSRIPGTRTTYRAAATAAIEALDAPTLAEIVGTWKQSVAPAAAPQVATDTKAKDELQRQVAPSSRRDSAPVAPQARIWTGEEYSAALDPRNASRMSKADYEALVASAEQAVAEGRVNW